MLNTEQIRKDFPILQRKVNGHSLTYLDNGATSQKPIQVINAISGYYSSHNANVHRGVHTLSAESTEMYESARKKVAKFINAEPEEIIFTKNASEALNLIAYTYGDASISPGDTITTSIMEHHSDFIPWQVLAKKKGATLSIMNATREGAIPESEYSKIGGAKLTSIVHASNVLGTINPVKEFAKLAHENEGVILVDGSQSVPHLPVDVKDLDCDFFAFTGHKMLGPTGIGVLYGKKELLEKMPPFLYGGEMVVDAKVDGCKWNNAPHKFEAGTPNMAGTIGLGAAVDYLANLGMENVRAHELELLCHAIDSLRQVEGLEIYGPSNPQDRTGVLSFNIEGLSSIDLSSLLDEYGFAIRSGFHCAQPLHDALGISPSARISFYIYNTKEEIALLKSRIEEAKKVMS
ncbi:SufS family cysteine desulfurase [Candidatus Micrarchaeota archaeon]|nr:SufS family cysteine desulfurase [Candidatus Micrarchaeota archaeon]MBD3418078.1 SufS family cysteine desulfurase [Candidatus Micrarchaeota archaeon]